MTSPAKVEANRRNALRSTGPKTAEGKDKVRFNALKHGLDAASVVLPDEDAEAYRQRLAQWTAELDPPGGLGRYLAERAVRLSWQLDRADAHEAAALARRSTAAPRDQARRRRARAEASVRRLLAPTADAEPARTGRGATAPGFDPARALARLMASAEGCRALAAAWGDVARVLSTTPAPLDGPIPADPTELPFVWALTEPVRMLRLMGVRDDRRAVAAAADPRARRILAVEQEAGRHATFAFWKWDDARHPDEHPDGPRGKPSLLDPALPAIDDAALRHELRALAEAERSSLEATAARHEAERAAEAEADEVGPAPASFDDTAEGERLHRYQAQWSRSLLRTLDALEKLRRSAIAPPEQTHRSAATTTETNDLRPVDDAAPGEEGTGERDHESHESHESEGRGTGPSAAAPPARPDPTTTSPFVPFVSFVVDASFQHSRPVWTDRKPRKRGGPTTKGTKDTKKIG